MRIAFTRNLGRKERAGRLSSLLMRKRPYDYYRSHPEHRPRPLTARQCRCLKWSLPTNEPPAANVRFWGVKRTSHFDRVAAGIDPKQTFWTVRVIGEPRPSAILYRIAGLHVPTPTSLSSQGRQARSATRTNLGWPRGSRNARLVERHGFRWSTT